MPWARPTFPHARRDEQRTRTVIGAQLSPVRQGRLRTFVRPDRWISGAVHDSEGRLVVASQKIGGLGGNRVVMADPAWLEPEPRRVPLTGPRRRRAERLEGRWLYGGHWMMHFGHFFTESVTTLWPEEYDVDGLVFHRFLAPDPVVEAWQRRLVDLAGHAGTPIRIVTDERLTVEELVVPSRSIVINGWAHEGCAEVWQRIAAGVPGAGPSPARVFFSRTAFNQALRAAGETARTTPADDALLDATFAAAGFEVVSPEQLHVDEQIRLARGADVLAGNGGTALHLAAFARPDTRVLELGDERSPRHPVPMQSVINTVSGHLEAFVEHGTPRDRLVAQLTELDLISPTTSPATAGANDTANKEQ